MSPASTSSARRIALQVLLELERGDCSGSGELLDRAIDRQAGDEADARLATALVLSVLRHQLWLDSVYRLFLTKSPSRLSEELRILLRLAAAQRHLFDRIPQHAIGNESTALARETLKLRPRDVAFVNAVARRIAEMEVRRPCPSSDTKDNGGAARSARRRQSGGASAAQILSVDFSHPPWLVEMLIAKYGAADALRVMAANNLDAPVAVRANRLRITRDEMCDRFAKAGISCRPGSVAPDSVILEGAGMLVAALRSDLFRRGLFYVQDEASQLVSVIAAPREGERVLDLCSAPGGKVTHMVEIAGGGATVVATDLSRQRLESVVENASRLQTPALEIAPIEEVHTRGPCFDVVLVDAPCSGLGTIRRHPEIRYRVTPATLERLAVGQLAILREAAGLLAPDGRIVYSTCSISETENAGVVREFLDAVPGFSVSRSIAQAAVPFEHDDGFYRTWPAHLDVDGFEVAVLARAGGAV